jgi:hypothetical protein
MKDELKSRLDAIFDAHDAAKKAAASAFVREFKRVGNTIIRPAMEEVGKHAEARGIAFEVSEEDEKLPDDRRGGGQQARIEIVFFPSGGARYPKHDYPAFTVICDKYKQNVLFHQRTMMPGKGGMSGSTGEASLADVTSEQIQTQILDVLAKAFE